MDWTLPWIIISVCIILAFGISSYSQALCVGACSGYPGASRGSQWPAWDQPRRGISSYSEQPLMLPGQLWRGSNCLLSKAAFSRAFIKRC